MKTLAELRKRLEEIGASLTAFQAKGALSADDKAEINKLHAEFEEVTADIEAQEKLEKMNAALTKSTRQTAPAAPAAAVQVGANRVEQDPKRGFKNAGEFYNAVKAKDDQRLRAAGLSEKFGEDGGFTVPEDFRSDIQKKVQGDESLLPKTAQFQTSSNNLNLPTNETAPWDSSGNFQAYWEGEAQQYRESKTKFGMTEMRLHKLTAMVRVTDELMDDQPAIESWIRVNAPDSMLHKVNSAIISGSGAGMPHGFLKSSFRVTVAKESGQAADTILFLNVNKMLAALLPSSIRNAVWLINPAVLPLLRTMVFDTGSSTLIPVYMPSTGVSGAPYGTLFGIPIMPMMGGVKAVGDEGDISLVDLKYYYTALKAGQSGIKTDLSTHVFFDTGESAFRFTMRMAGQVPYKAPVTNEAGDYQCSGIVTLADRA